MNLLYVNLSAHTDDPNQFTRVPETFQRAANGLALEGIDVFMSWGLVPEDDEEKG